MQQQLVLLTCVGALREKNDRIEFVTDDQVSFAATYVLFIFQCLPPTSHATCSCRQTEVSLNLLQEIVSCTSGFIETPHQNRTYFLTVLTQNVIATLF